METIELLIYLGITILVGSLIVGFLTGWDFVGSYKGMKDVMMEDDELGFEKLKPNEFAGKLQTFFTECTNRAENMTLTVYVQGDGSFNKADLFAIYKDLGWCEIIQSADQGCGAREDLSMGMIELPKVVRASCTGTNMSIS